MTIVDQIVEKKVHIGTVSKYSHPKTSKFRLGKNENTIIIDPDIIEAQLNSAKDKISSYVAKNSPILLICEKSVCLPDIENISTKLWINYFYTNTPSGILTNFNTIFGRIKSMQQLESFVWSDDFFTLTKKEQLMKKRELAKVQKVYKWVKNLKAKPELVIIVDGNMLSKFVDEVEKINIDHIIISNTDFDRYASDNSLIISNTKSHTSLQFILNYIFNIK